MGRTRALIALLILLAVTAGGLGAWAYARQGYPDVVYYYRYVLPASAQYPGLAYEVWDDPRRHWMRTLTTPAKGTPDTWLYRDGYQYDLGVRGGNPKPDSRPRGGDPVDAALRAGGLAALDTYWYANTTGRRSLVRFGGHSALRFDAVDAAGGRVSTWLDARTHELLGMRFLLTDRATVVMRRFTRWARYAPNTLPAGFFDPTNTRWDGVLRWVRDRLAGR